MIIGDIDARGEASPVLIIGYSPLASSSGAVLVSGGDLSQSNGSSIGVGDNSPGFQSIRSIDGTRSDGIGLPARVISAPFRAINKESVVIPTFY